MTGHRLGEWGHALPPGGVGAPADIAPFFLSTVRSTTRRSPRPAKPKGSLTEAEREYVRSHSPPPQLGVTAIARNLGRGRSAINKVVKDEGLRERGVRDDAPPDALIRPHVDWPRKAVLALANRSVLDGYTAKDAEVADELRAISDANDLTSLYRRSVIGQLKHCCGFWTVTGSGSGSPVISAYPATAAALWDDALKSIRCGLVVVESAARQGTDERVPTLVGVYEPGCVIELRADGGRWVASYRPHGMGRPLMEPMPYEPTLERPFGQSRITRTVMSITDDAVREKARSEIAAEFAAFPQKWLLGTDAETINDGNRYSAAMGVMQEVAKDPDGDSPTIWQSPQLTMQPHIDYMRSLAAQFAGETDLPLSSLGVVSDNPSSAEAIYAAKEDLVIDAQNLNRSNAQALRNVALMALAVSHGTDWATERDAGHGVEPMFRDEARPSVVSMSDALLKQVQAIPWLADTDVALEMLGYNEEQRQRMQSDKKRAQADAAISSLFAPTKEAESANSSQPAGRADA